MKKDCGLIYKKTLADNTMSKNESCGVLTRRQLRKGHHFVAITKKVASFLKGKVGATPSVAAPGDTNPGDATVVFTSCL